MVTGASGSGFSWTQAVPWLLSSIALLWNWFNYRATQKLKEKDRDFDEWKLERDTVFQQLRSFEDSLDLLRPLSVGRHDLAGLEGELEKANLAISLAHGKLVREIERAREMKAPVGSAYGMAVDGESAWDRLNTHLAEAAVMTDADLIRAKLPVVVACGHEIRRSVEEVCKRRPKT